MAVGEDEFAEAGRLLRAGRLVAFPTETVYGLGANALDPQAVGRIFAAKGRPSTSPLIAHVDSVEMARQLVTFWPEAASVLARRFWPGPLTLILPKQPSVPDVVTAGLSTVGLRMPAHPVALRLIGEAGVPIAAPSANRFTQLSPTTAEHVRRNLGDRVDLILDGGPSEIGIESTVISLAAEPPLLFRPGVISRAQLEAVIGPVALPGSEPRAAQAHASPGLARRHYSPRTPLLLAGEGPLPGGRGAYLYYSRSRQAALVRTMPGDPVPYAATLYAILHALDDEGLDWIAVEQPPDTTEWAAVNDRLRRAAAR
ncbi:MAG: L-threonylcarbamoyladenylate synthase [Acidobacteria bacterium]|nr:L-threonylcarbamoyladenylate synthase [Acidobacteriota bacterium]